MDVEPSMTSASALDDVAQALERAGFVVSPGSKRLPHALRIRGVSEDREHEVWAIVRTLDPMAEKVSPASAWTHD
jgi:hypothetical protein